MAFTTLISAQELDAHLGDAEWAIVDCRFSLADPVMGRRDYLQNHIPGAVYAHLNDDLCAPIRPGVTGRHPLPQVEQAVATFARLGITENVQVVAYDDWPGASGAVAARLWWMLRWLGREQVAVLDGGWAHWRQLGYATRSGEETRPPGGFRAHLRPEFYASSQDVEQRRLEAQWRVFDSRSADRYRGENETIDPVAGHIPGAISAPYLENAAADGSFRPVGELRERFRALLKEVPASQTIFYCGSGVTAAHNVLAMAHAGLGIPRLYVGSWSEWITDPSRPVAT